MVIGVSSGEMDAVINGGQLLRGSLPIIKRPGVRDNLLSGDEDGRHPHCHRHFKDNFDEKINCMDDIVPCLMEPEGLLGTWYKKLHRDE